MWLKQIIFPCTAWDGFQFKSLKGRGQKESELLSLFIILYTTVHQSFAEQLHQMWQIVSRKPNICLIKKLWLHCSFNTNKKSKVVLKKIEQKLLTCSERHSQRHEYIYFFNLTSGECLQTVRGRWAGGRGEQNNSCAGRSIERGRCSGDRRVLDGHTNTKTKNQIDCEALNSGQLWFK